MLLADNMLLKQMVGNLLDNAHPARETRRNGDRNGHSDITGAITIRIVDDGEGIPPEQRDRIFERFARFDSRSQGAGLGLPIARWIAEAHGGTPGARIEQCPRQLLRCDPPSVLTLSSAVHLYAVIIELLCHMTSLPRPLHVRAGRRPPRLHLVRDERPGSRPRHTRCSHPRPRDQRHQGRG